MPMLMHIEVLIFSEQQEFKLKSCIGSCENEYNYVCLALQDVHATNIILNPGLAFGTGEHPTTKLCLLLLQGLIKGGEFFLDYGTGSGILAIAALKVINFVFIIEPLILS